MTDTEAFDPFAGIVDDLDSGPSGALAGLLDAAKRGYVPLRKSFPQREAGSAEQEKRPSARASVLYDFVNNRQQRAFDLLLLVHALQPILGGTPLPLATYANIMSVGGPVDTTGISRALATLQDMDLLVREDESRAPVLRLLREDGSREPWIKAGTTAEAGPGYFTIPHTYWTSGLAQKLTMPGKAMFLIILSETQNPKTPAFNMAVERAHDWYGISERTAERGYTELSKAGVLRTKIQKVKDDRHPAGRREVYWRALTAPFDTQSRVRLQGAAVKAVKGSSASTTTGLASAAPLPAVQDATQAAAE